MSYLTDGAPLLFVPNDFRGSLAQAIQDIALVSPQLAYFQARATGTVALPDDASYNRITFDTTLRDVGGLGTIIASPWSFTVARTGWYTLVARVTIRAITVSPSFVIAMNVNGVNNPLITQRLTSVDFYVTPAVYIGLFTAGDVVHITVAHYNGGTCEVSAGAEITFSP